MKDDRFAGLGVGTLGEAERESVVRLPLVVVATRWPTAL